MKALLSLLSLISLSAASSTSAGTVHGLHLHGSLQALMPEKMVLADYQRITEFKQARNVIIEAFEAQVNNHIGELHKSFHGILNKKADLDLETLLVTYLLAKKVFASKFEDFSDLMIQLPANLQPLKAYSEERIEQFYQKSTHKIIQALIKLTDPLYLNKDGESVWSQLKLSRRMIERPLNDGLREDLKSYTGYRLIGECKKEQEAGSKASTFSPVIKGVLEAYGLQAEEMWKEYEEVKKEWNNKLKEYDQNYY